MVMDSQRTRDLAVLCIRMFAGPNCPAHEEDAGGEGGDTAGEGYSYRCQTPSGIHSGSPEHGLGVTVEFKHARLSFY